MSRPTTTEGWATLLAQGDGRGLVPIETARALHAAGLLTTEPKPTRRGPQGAAFVTLAKQHDCDEHAVYVTTDGALGHGWECGRCGAFLQAG